MIFATNKSLKAWGGVLHDEDLAQAIIDRALERGRLIRLDGPSVRTLHLKLDEVMKEGSRSGRRNGQNCRKQVVRISGTHNGKGVRDMWTVACSSAAIQVVAAWGVTCDPDDKNIQSGETKQV